MRGISFTESSLNSHKLSNVINVLIPTRTAIFCSVSIKNIFLITHEVPYRPERYYAWLQACRRFVARLLALRLLFATHFRYSFCYLLSSAVKEQAQKNAMFGLLEPR